MREPIAIIGMASRFPGAENGPESLWKLLEAQTDPSSEVPADRWNAEAYYDLSPSAPYKANTTRGSFLSGVDQFDTFFFGISPREVQAMDPQQRLALEVAWESMADAGLSLEAVQAVKTGVFLGIGWTDYEERFGDQIDPDLFQYRATGNALSVASGRISFAFDLTGAAISVDTNYSSSLVAIHLGCESLRSRTSDVILAGGVSLMVSPLVTVAMSKLGALAPDGRCKTFDASGDGYGRGEGCGMVVLKRLSDAEREGDRIWAVIRGSAVNQDGHTSGFMAPNPVAQAKLIQTALAFGGLDPDAVQYLEAHGTGTALGDSIEVEGLTAVFGQRTGPPLALGSVKTNIGHLEMAAGVAGLMKTVLAMKHRLLPANLHFKNPNPRIPFDQIPIRVQTVLGPWPKPDAPLIAGVNSFGFSGTNAHVVLEEAPTGLREKWAEADASAAKGGSLLLVVSAKTPAALKAYAEKYATSLENKEEAEEGATYRDVAYTASCRQTHLEHRLSVVGKSRADWAKELRGWVRGETTAGAAHLSQGYASETKRRIAMVFSGHGPQWWGMGRELFDKEPVYRAAVEKCAELIDAHTTWKLLEELGRDEVSSRLGEGDTEIAQPALFAVQIGLVELWKAWGVEPSAVMGHSIGEMTAAYVSGALTLEGACRLIVAAARAQQKVPGKMASVPLGLEEAEKLIADFPGLEIGGSNGPRATVLSGDANSLESALAMLHARGVAATRLRMNSATHTTHMGGVADELTMALKEFPAREPLLPMVSTVTGELVTKFSATHWADWAVKRVRFYEGTKKLLEEGYDVVVEVGAHPVLMPALDQTIEETGKKVTVVASLRRKEPEREAMLVALGTLHCTGYPVDWTAQYSVRGRVVSLPSYPWQHTRHWIEQRKSRGGRPGHSPLVHRHMEVAGQPGKHLFETDLDLNDPELSYFSDYEVSGQVLVPAAALVELALEAAEQAYGARVEGLQDVSFDKALEINSPRSVQLVMDPQGEDQSRFRIFSRELKEGPVGQDEAVAHGGGVIRLARDRRGRVGQGKKETLPSIRELQERCGLARSVGAAYEKLAERGLQYGPKFQGLVSLQMGEGEALGKLGTPLEAALNLPAYKVHPTFLDAAFQAVLLAVPLDAQERAYVPSRLQELCVYGGGRSDRAAWAYARRRETDDGNGFEADVWMLDDAGEILVEARGLRMVPLEGAADKLDRSVFEMQWRTVATDKPESTEGTWLLLGDSQGLAPALRTWLEARGARVVSVSSGAGFTQHDATHVTLDPLKPEPFRRLLKEMFGSSPPKHIVHLWSLDSRGLQAELTEAQIARAGELSCSSTLHLVQAIAQMGWRDSPRLFLVSRGCQPATSSHDVVFPEQALLWGFGATIVHEFPKLRSTLIDLDPQSLSADALGHELAHADRENRIALRGSERRAPRLVQHVRPARSPGALRLLLVGSEGYRLSVLQPGQIHSLTLEPCAVPTAGPGEVVIRTRASGLDSNDAMMALGLYPGIGEGRLPMGSDCSGVIAAVGDGVDGLRPGDEVVGSAIHAFDAFARAPAALVVKKPSSLTFEQAASLPTAMMTALYALERVGRLKKGERILIHAATDGVGLAALQYAKHVGARILATANSEAQRAYLRSLGVEHVYDSRSFDWAEGVQRDTEGQGVDVVLNSLAGEAVAKGLGVLAPFGRFLELGKRDVDTASSLGLYALRNNITVASIALDQLVLKRPEEAHDLLVEIFCLFEQGALQSPPVQTFPISRAVDAFRHLAHGQYVGKIVLLSQDAITVRDPACSENILRKKTYLITGGLGGLGLVVAKRLARLGATHLALMGRRAPSDSAKVLIREFEQAGAHVYVVSADVADYASLERGLEEIERSAPPIAGVIHMAGVLDDVTLLNLTADRIAPVLAPKVLGTFFLASLLPQVDSVVLFSSVTGVLGAAGQANYSAANAFLDAFAHHRARADKHALSLDWGVWADAGPAAQATERVDNMARQGMTALAPDEGADLFQRLFPSSSRQLVLFPVEVHQWRQANPQLAALPLLSGLLARAPRAVTPMRGALLDRLHKASESERFGLLNDAVRSAIAHIIRSSPEAVPRDAPLKQLGIDSILVVSLKNTLEREFDVRISTANIFDHPTVEGLARLLHSRLASPVEAKLISSSTGETKLSPRKPDALPAQSVNAALEAELEQLLKRGFTI